MTVPKPPPPRSDVRAAKALLRLLPISAPRSGGALFKPLRIIDIAAGGGSNNALRAPCRLRYQYFPAVPAFCEFPQRQKNTVFSVLFDEFKTEKLATWCAGTALAVRFACT